MRIVFQNSELKKFVLLLIFIQLFLGVKAQTKSSSVINSAGTERAGSTLILTDNVGETFIITATNVGNKITQGFLQPETVSKMGFSVSPIFQSLMCLDKEDDAFIALTLAPSVSTQTVSYLWSPSTVCPNNDCAKIDSLKPGVYKVAVVIAYKGKLGAVMHDTLRPSQFVIENATSPCLIKVYSGITANGDGVDDVLQIDNITEFPGNRVTIYNRWGEMLFDVKGYNDKDPSRSWPTGSAKDKLTASTYFYVIELGNGDKPMKGWVELLKN